MLKTILFDLDGTLLPLNMEDFLKKYFQEISVKFKDYFTPQELTKLIWESTEYMVKNIDANKTNADAFFEDFYSKIPYTADLFNPMFDDFYTNNFLKVKEATQESEYIIKAVDILKEKGYEMVVATNPLFPEKAIFHRIAWAGLNKEDFTFITSFEKMHFCKPHLQFYEEILGKINREPRECMMVGNDIEEDMVAKQLGLATYLIEDHKIHRSKDMKNVDYTGKYPDFYRFVIELPSVK
ncbi:HAD family hydrolase [Natronincola ferrireducens]|uniref:FMN phosphatase YigB, HAD superfamily n=1 Tax=Natronincola ferrireducens TaxID=393762 RepID=A0A1G8YMY2_9FIRM|nr:HAD family hydrolase [Natronincola ferrireducens]SDK04097.1 FMN phosphatase YigB, HAD superfamily [Natronincola ferrireducens]